SRTGAALAFWLLRGSSPQTFSDSNQGRAMETPSPRNMVRRENLCVVMDHQILQQDAAVPSGRAEECCPPGIPRGEVVPWVDRKKEKKGAGTVSRRSDSRALRPRLFNRVIAPYGGKGCLDNVSKACNGTQHLLRPSACLTTS